jgi:hypothetical protein
MQIAPTICLAALVGITTTIALILWDWFCSWSEREELAEKRRLEAHERDCRERGQHPH